MLVYYPDEGATFRVVWFGGGSTKLHYQQLIDGEWSDRLIRAFVSLPRSVKDLWIEMSNFYQDAAFIMMEDC
jgi:hypothetical protein